MELLTIYNCLYYPPESPRSVLDGDTFRCKGDIEPIIPDSKMWVPKVRVVKINAPETGELGAEQARSRLIDWLSLGPFDLACFGRDKYGRLLGDAVRKGSRVSDHMLAMDFVRPMTVKMARELLLERNDELARAIAHA